MSIQPGDLFQPSEWSTEIHRLIVVSDERHNRGGQVVIVPVWSSQLERRRRMPSCVVFSADRRRFDRECYAKTDGISTIATADLGEQLEGLTDSELYEVRKAICTVLGIDWPGESRRQP